MRRYIIYIEKSCKLFKSPKTGRASKYKESNSPKTNKAFFKKKIYIYIYIFFFFFSLRDSTIKLGERYHHPC